MKSIIKTAIVSLLAVAMASLISCAKLPGIKKAFEKEGYTYSETVSAIYSSLVEDINGDEEKAIVTPHVFTKGLNMALVLEFSSTKEMNDALKDNETLKGMLKDSQKSDYINGNCVLIAVGLDFDGMTKIFKNA